MLVDGNRLSRGFVTVATGKYYYWLAENLVMSYRQFSGGKIPFYLRQHRTEGGRWTKSYKSSKIKV